MTALPLGAVLAGGESRRFGSPKAWARFRGVPMAVRQILLLEEAGLTAAVVLRPGAPSPVPGVPVLRDRVPGKGPLAGLEAALAEAARRDLPGAFVTGCDLPLLPPRLVRAVVERFLDEGADRVVVPWSGGPLGMEPLAGCYPVALLGTVRERLSDGPVALHDLVASTNALVLPESVVSTLCEPGLAFRNVNTPDDRGAHEAIPPIVCVSGLKDSGKTTLVVQLASELTAGGRRVMTVKHGHGFELDTPGTDSWRHRFEGSAVRTVLAGPESFAVMGAWAEEGEVGLEELVTRFLPDADVVLAEGYKRSPLPRIEIHRTAAHPRPLFEAGTPFAATYLALVTDLAEMEAPVPLLAPDDPELVTKLARIVEEALLTDRDGTEGTKRPRPERG